MHDNFSSSQVVRKRVVATRDGIVAAQHKRAAQAGASILEAGGDAIDAAVAPSFALGVVEPWMSGITAGGAMVLWRAKERQAYAIDYGMRSPATLKASDYPVIGGRDPELFGWPRVKDDRNVQGAAAVAVPGVVAGMALAHERFGRLAWRELVAPAVQLAREGMLLDWFAGLQIASTARALSLDPDAAAMFLDEGKWAPLSGWTVLSERRVDQRRLSGTLDAIAREGAKALYGGDVGAAIAKDVRDKGGCLALADLAGYQASIAAPLEAPYHRARIFAAPGFRGGPGHAGPPQFSPGVGGIGGVTANPPALRDRRPRRPQDGGPRAAAPLVHRRSGGAARGCLPPPAHRHEGRRGGHRRRCVARR